MDASPKLSDCQVTYHLNSGQNLSESYRQDIPEEVWKSVMEAYLAFSQAIELQPSTEFAKVLLPKSNVAYITMKVYTH